MYAVLLGGAASETERALGVYVREHRQQIADMAGEHCRLAIVGFGHHDGDDRGENVYDLARGHGVELAALPALVALADVGGRQRSWSRWAMPLPRHGRRRNSPDTTAGRACSARSLTPATTRARPSRPSGSRC
ncbi:MAG TPA: hypothetical protein VF230_17455 [Acidimicrobiales bacterium]